MGCWYDAGTVKSGVGGARLRERRRGEDEDEDEGWSGTRRSVMARDAMGVLWEPAGGVDVMDDGEGEG